MKFAPAFLGLLACSVAFGPGTGLAQERATPCTPIAGAEAVLAPRHPRYFIFGEMHGTNEAPQMFGELVCGAAQAGPIVVGLELPETEQGALDAYLASPGDEAARAALLGGPLWQYRDGRGSAAMLRLIERLRVLRTEGASIRVIAFAPQVRGTSFSQAPYERAMAERWRRALEDAPDAKLLVLVGNIHSRLAGFDSFEPAAMHLPRGETLTFTPAAVDGTAYNCTDSHCGVHRLGAGAGPSFSPGLTEMPDQWRSGLPYDYLYAPDGPFTASHPAIDRIEAD